MNEINGYKKLIVSESQEDDKNQGLIRINVRDRKNIKRKKLVLIEIEGKKSKLVRRVYGLKKLGYVLMDFDTRFNDGKWKLEPGKTYLFKLKKVHWYDIWSWLVKYYFNHSDISLRVTFIIGFSSFIIAIIALMLSLLLS